MKNVTEPRSFEQRNSVGDMIAGEVILPVQFWDQLAGIDRSVPERRLMLAVLENAILTLQRHVRPPQTVRGRRSVAEVERWIASDSRAHPFAFAAICDVLDINVGYLRGVIRKWLHDVTLAPHPRRRHAGRGRHQIAPPRRHR
jgi:hypothetical protein